MTTHVHNFDGRWPFADAENAAVFCCGHVHAKQWPILRVVHDHDGDWQFLCGGSHEGESPVLLCFGCMIESDPSLVALADLPVGWGADRSEANAEWYREANAPDDEQS